MISSSIKEQIVKIWDKYIKSGRIVYNTKGEVIGDIDEARLRAIEDIKIYIESFLSGKITISEFKTSLDGYNKRNNLWGFTAAKGQMFFNLLVNTSESIGSLTDLLKSSISEPKDLEDAKQKLEKFERFVRQVYDKGSDKRKVPKPGSTGYFLSYFWQIHNNQKWPILYSSLVNSFERLGIWKEWETQKEEYEFFYHLNEEVKSILAANAKQPINNWDAEHAFWSDSENPRTPQKVTTHVGDSAQKEESLPLIANFNVSDYLIPRVARLVELGASKDKNKGSEFEKMVSEAFKQLDFEVEILGQGTGRNPDAILKFREEHTAFIVDAKAYSEGYSLGIDDRAIKEYISHFCPKLTKEGFKKIGFIIVSNSFKSGLEDFISDVTWTTDVKRFILLSSEALLYLLAYSSKDSLSTKSIIEFLVNTDSPILKEAVIAKFDDV